MTKILVLKKTTILLISILSFQVIADSSWAVLSPKPSESAGSCGITVGDAHQSSNIWKTKNVIAVKINAKSKCDKIMHNLEIVVEIYKAGNPFDHLVAPFISKTYGTVGINKIIQMENAWIACKNTKRTTYFGIAYGHGFINGVTWSSPIVRSENNFTFNCGT